MALPETRQPRVSNGLGLAALRGVAVMGSQTVLIKGVSFVAQIALGWMLAPEAFGLLSLVLSVSLLTQVLKDGGTSDVLVQAGTDWHRLVSPAFWLSVSLGLFSSVVVLLVALPAASHFQDTLLIPLLGLMALEGFVTSFSVVPAAALQRSMRFKRLASIEIFTQCGISAAAVVLAASGCGVFSFLLPRPAFAALRVGLLWLSDGPRISLQPTTNGWMEILEKSWYLIATTLLYRIYSQIDYLVLAFFTDQRELGIYYFAFSLSIQSVALLSSNLGIVFFPAFARMADEPDRQSKAYVRTCHIVARIGIPAVALQAAAANPGMLLVFGEKWIEAIPLIQLLSLGLGFRIAGGVAMSLLKANGRFRLLFIVNLVSSLAAVGAVVGAGLMDTGSAGVATAISLWSVAYGLGTLAVASRSVGGSITMVFRVFLFPLGLVAVAVFPWYLIDLLLFEPHDVPPLIRLAVVVVGSIISVGVFLYNFDRETLTLIPSLASRRGT